MDKDKAADLGARHKAENHAPDMLLAGDVNTVSSLRGRITVRWYWCPRCGCAYGQRVAFYDLQRVTEAQYAGAKETERVQRQAVAARLKEFSGGSGLIPGDATFGR